MEIERTSEVEYWGAGTGTGNVTELKCIQNDEKREELNEKKK